MMLSIIIVNWNTCADILRCLQSTFAHPPMVEFEVLVVDNASTDGSLAAVRAAFSQVTLLASTENVGFARANNLAAAQARGQYWLLLNPDAALHASSLEMLLKYMQGSPRVAAIGPRLLNPDGSLQPSIARLPTLFREWWRLFHLDRLCSLSQYPAALLASDAAIQVEVLNGACLMLRREAVAGLSLFDDDYFVYSEEVDFCDRLQRAGWELHWLPTATVTHTGGQSTRQVADQMFLELYRNKLKFFRKRRGRLSAALYKLLLVQAGLVRVIGGQAVRLWANNDRRGLGEVARQYRMLLTALPRM